MLDQRILDRGFETEGILTMRIDLPDGRYPEDHQWQPFFDATMDRFETIPGIDSIGWVSSRPLAEFDGFSSFVIDGKENSGPDELPSTTVTTGTQGAFDVLRIPVVRGRGLAPTDNAGGLPIALVNEDMVERYWDGEDPIGGRVRIGGYQSDAPWLTVVGVIGNMYSGNPEQPSFPQMIVPLRQNVTRNLGLLVRPVDGGDPLALVADIRREVAAVDADQPLGDVRTLSQIFDDQLATFDTLISVFIVFAVFALLMASTGIYGVISFSVAQRTQEIGIRMALGARGNDVMRMINRQAMWLVGVGIGIGTLASIVLSRILASAVPGLSPNDPFALGGVAIVLTAAAAIAVWIPARRAVRIDPIIALRQE